MPVGHSKSTYQPLSEREQEILRLVVRSFVETAGPVGSRYLARHYPLGLSPASIRNTMSDLEERGYLGHPYTSAGRTPTDLGYRTFVDELMATPDLSPAEKRLIQKRMEELIGETEDLYRASSRLLGRMSNLLGVVLSPRLSSGVLERLEVVPLSSSRVMFVISVVGGFVKTLVLEVEAAINRTDLQRIVSILNERLAGLRLDEIQRTYATRTRDLEDDRTGIVRLMLDESAVLFSEPPGGRLSLAGTPHLIAQPEFREPDEVRNLIALIEDEGYVVRLFEGQQPDLVEKPGRVVVSIGSENEIEQADHLSIVTAPYKIGDTTGMVGILGPTRMDYERAVALVETMARLLSRPADAA